MKDHRDDVNENGKAMREAADPDVREFASVEYQTVLSHRKEIDALYTQLGK